jgi:hypothetical protein
VVRHEPGAAVGDVKVDGRPVLGFVGRERFVLLTEQQQRVWSLIPAHGCSTAELQEHYEAASDDAGDWIPRFLSELRSRGFLATPDGPTEEVRGEPAVMVSAQPSRLLADVSIRLPGRLREALELVGRSAALSRGALAAQAALVVVAVVVHGRDVLRGPGTAMAGLDLVHVVAVYGLFVLTAVVHELGHALAMARYTDAPRRGGLMVRYVLFVGFYVRTTGAWALPRRQRVIVGLAGPWLNFVCGALLFFSGHAVQGDEGATLVAAGSLSVLVGALNLFPFFLKTDGYYVLNDLLETSNWRRRGSSIALAIVRRSRPIGSLSLRDRIIVWAFVLQAGFWLFLLHRVSHGLSRLTGLSPVAVVLVLVGVPRLGPLGRYVRARLAVRRQGRPT